MTVEVNGGMLGLREIYASQLTSPTTCYSGARFLEENDKNEEQPSKIARLCTENHMVALSIADESIEVVCDIAVPKNSSSMICAGFSTDGESTALTFLDSHLLDAPFGAFLRKTGNTRRDHRRLDWRY